MIIGVKRVFDLIALHLSIPNYLKMYPQIGKNYSEI